MFNSNGQPAVLEHKGNTKPKCRNMNHERVNSCYASNISYARIN